MSLAVPYFDRVRITSLNHSAETLNMHLSNKSDVPEEIRDLAGQIAQLAQRLHTMAQTVKLEEVAA
jgi:hypothetical protein